MCIRRMGGFKNGPQSRGLETPFPAANIRRTPGGPYAAPNQTPHGGDETKQQTQAREVGSAGLRSSRADVEPEGSKLVGSGTPQNGAGGGWPGG